MTIPVLETARLRLRPVTPADAPAIVEGVGDWDVAKWLAVVPHPYTADDAREFIEERKDRHLVRDGEIDTAQAHGAHAQEGIGEFLRSHFHGEVSPVETAVGERGFLHHTGRIFGNGLSEYTNQFGFVVLAHSLHATILPVPWLERSCRRPTRGNRCCA